MDCTMSFPCVHFDPEGMIWCNYRRVTLIAHSERRKPPKDNRYRPRPKQPPEFGVNLFLKKPSTTCKPTEDDTYSNEKNDGEEDQNIGVVWKSDEIEAISSLFQGRIPQKHGKLDRERPLPLPVPYKLRPLGLPTPKTQLKLTAPAVISSRVSMAKKVYKSPSFLVGLESGCSSLSLTIRELDHVRLSERALQTFLWAQNQPHLFPDDWILASTVEVLA